VGEVEGIKKLYYSISEVSEMTGLAPHVLRYWESEFEELHPKKNRAGNRVYTQNDIKTLEHIHSLLKDDKYTIEGARQALRSGDSGAAASEFRARLKELRDFLEELLHKL
jgi:DNA-binding transcriptional MerR regulator